MAEKEIDELSVQTGKNDVATEWIANRIKAVMIGHAVGDALGVPAEFASREEMDGAPVTDMEGFGTYPYPPGSWSDDTSMALCTLESLAKGGIDYDDIMQNFGRWYYKDEFTPTGETFDIGGTCATAIENYFVYRKPAVECGLCDEHSNGNGSLMRIHPFALMAWFDERLRPGFETIIENASALTHAHERSKLACKIYTLILFHLLESPCKGAIGDALREASHRYADNPECRCFERLFDVGFEKLRQEEIRSTGYVVDTLEAAVWCILTTNSYKNCVLKAVNLGDDTDTVAAVAGGLAGALYGYESIPEEWLNTLIKRKDIEKLCERASAAPMRKPLPSV